MPTNDVKKRPAPSTTQIATSRVTHYREKAKMTPHGLCQELKMSLECLRRAEQGQNVRVSTLMQLAEYFNVGLNQLWQPLKGTVQQVRQRVKPVVAAEKKSGGKKTAAPSKPAAAKKAVKAKVAR